MPGWIPDDAQEEADMLATLGLRDADELFREVPKKARIGRMGVGPTHDEAAVVTAIDKMLDRNRPASGFAAFLGGRTPLRYSPAAVDAILGRSEFYTSYTPYQPEASQGMLQALFEFQSLWAELSAMDVANASLYDGATAAGEAMLMCRRLHEGRRFLVPASLFWEERSVLENYGAGIEARVESIPFDEQTGSIDQMALQNELERGDVFGMLVDLPNGFGHVDEALPDLKARMRDVPLAVLADPLALAVLEPPGHWGADIVVGEGAGFGIPPSYGGPLLGLFAFRREHARVAPGRIVGATRDHDGRRAFALTLQTREQHIRRARATSNICTNESLVALAFVVYASLVGPRGLAQLAVRLNEYARTLASALGAIDGLSAPRFNAPFLTDFTVELRRGEVDGFLGRLRRAKVLGGYPLRDPRPSMGDARMRSLYRVGVHEGTDEKQIAKYAKAARSAVVPGERP